MRRSAEKVILKIELFKLRGRGFSGPVACVLAGNARLQTQLTLRRPWMFGGTFVPGCSSRNFLQRRLDSNFTIESRRWCIPWQLVIYSS
jgi:hypothetical protein